MIDINGVLSLRDDEIVESFIRASGPGGQNVNRVASAVQLRFDITNSPSLPEGLKVRLIRLGGRRVTNEGVLVISAQRFRTQERNRADALERLIALILEAAERPVFRVPTRPTLASKRRRLESKKVRSGIKEGRRLPSDHS